jgi:hypothetical protein
MWLTPTLWPRRVDILELSRLLKSTVEVLAVWLIDWDYGSANTGNISLGW